MATKTSDESSTGAVADVRDKGAELVSAAQEQVGAKAEVMRSEAAFQLRERVEQGRLSRLRPASRYVSLVAR